MLVGAGVDVFNGVGVMVLVFVIVGVGVGVEVSKGVGVMVGVFGGKSKYRSKQGSLPSPSNEVIEKKLLDDGISPGTVKLNLIPVSPEGLIPSRLANVRNS